MTSKVWPPKHVTVITDRYGKRRYRYRRAGVASRYIPHEPKSPDFWAMYESLEAEGLAPRQEVRRHYPPYSMDDLAAKVRRAPKWKQMQPHSQIGRAHV